MSRRGIQRTGVRSEEELSIPVYTVTARDTVPVQEEDSGGRVWCFDMFGDACGLCWRFGCEEE
ncbi:hypothetical protein CTAM01_14249 [Colletotrichum tamarilloi]|uniref:Uncharacterized protein n=1 Tax=Colletotrichum tamarilloi TaxID=1209934 RepID=A0ABQ9QPW5_9PEZI|nr:uncharacterized protein CTAM01_14249 [Colletotrichum tamarilloi]KAI3538452.1 hypothetical protein CSPX01_09589 [Colletotrichum filicis]KAK1480687.1 hypothetical protein CTAM01_14249 [Colletotrichum tamarilloi]